MRIYWIAPVCLTLLLGGCESLNTIHRVDSFNSAQDNESVVISVDAKQRMIYASNPPKSGTRYRRFCAEPAPDALTALSTGLSGDVGLGALRSTNPDLKLRAALSMSESASTIERTQTVNVLREAMFRTCERYLSGAISDDEFIIQSVRDQRMIVSVLAIEQLTRVARPPATVINSGASSASYSDPIALQGALKRALEEQYTETQAKTAAQTAYAALKVGETPCSADVTLPEKPAGQTDADYAPLKLAYEQCQLKVADFKRHEAALARADDMVSTYRAMVERQALGMTSSAGLGAGSSIRLEAVSGPSGNDLALVATAVKEIALKSYDSDEIYMTCVIRLRKLSDPNRYVGLDARTLGNLQDLDARCIQLLDQRAQVEIAHTAAGFEAVVRSAATTRLQDGEVIRGFLRKTEGGATPVTQWDKVRAAAGVPAAAWPAYISEDKAVSDFVQLSADIQKKIIAALSSGAST